MAGDSDLDSLGLSDDEVRQQYPLIARPAPAMQPVSVRGVNIPQVQPEPEAPSMMRSATEIPPVTPTVASPLEQQTAKDRTMQSELSRGSGIAQIGNPWARGALRGLNIAGEIGAAAIPELRPVLNAIPGTEEHHQQLLGRNTAALNEDEAQAEKEAQTAEAGARTGLANAQTGAVPSEVDLRTAQAENQRSEAAERANKTGELWVNVPTLVGPNGQPVEYEKNSGKYRYADLAGAKLLKTPTETAAADKQANETIAAQAALAGFPLDNPKTFQHNLAAAVKAKAITQEQAAKLHGFNTLNATPNTNLDVHIAGNEQAQAAAINKMFEGKEVIAYTPDGRRVQMPYAEAQKQGIPPERLVALNPKEAQDTRDKVASIETTFQGLDRYRKDLRDTSPKLSQNERDALRVLTEHTEKTTGALGGLLDELPIAGPLSDYSNRLLHGTITSDQYKSLSPEGKKLVSDYFTSVIDNFASMKARLGSVGRNPMQLQAEVNTIPLPYLDWESAIPQFENKRLSLSGYTSQMPELYSPSK